MAWYGTREGFNNQEARALFIYWGIFVLFFLTTLYMALLDIRYIFLEFKLGERELFDETIGNEAFRQAIRDAQQANKSADPSDEH